MRPKRVLLCTFSVGTNIGLSDVPAAGLSSVRNDVQDKHGEGRTKGGEIIEQWNNRDESVLRKVGPVQLALVCVVDDNIVT